MLDNFTCLFYWLWSFHNIFLEKKNLLGRPSECQGTFNADQALHIVGPDQCSNNSRQRKSPQARKDLMDT